MIVLFAVAGCKKPETPPIEGKWKLIEVLVHKNYYLLETINFSDNNIVYEFKSNNVLIVRGSIPDLPIFDDFQEGKHFYEYQHLGFCATPCDNLSIDNSGLWNEKSYCCQINLDNKTMTIGNDGIDIEGDYFSYYKTFIKLNN
jgi:hypothetical protein